MRAQHEKALKTIADRAREEAMNPLPAYSQIQIRQAEERLIAAVLALELGQLNCQLGQLIEVLRRPAGRRS
jgi:hypothetical protein